MSHPHITERTTIAQWGVVVGVASVAALLLGGYLLYLSFGAPQEKAELAAKALWFGGGMIAASPVLGILSYLMIKHFD